jgi:hypothetical protein
LAHSPNTLKEAKARQKSNLKKILILYLGYIDMVKKSSHATVPLKKTTPLLYTSCNVHVRYPQSGPAAQNRETVTWDICRAVDTIRDIAEGGGEGGGGGGGQTQKDQGKKVRKIFNYM